MRHTVTAEWLKQNFDDQNLVVLDASMRNPLPGVKKDNNGRVIKGARYFDFEQKIKAQDNPLPNMMPSPVECEAHMQALGINHDSVIVVYDNVGVYSAPRVWWMIRAMGHEQVFVLNGGLAAWEAIEGETADVHDEGFPHGNFQVESNALFVDVQQVLEATKDHDIAILDARSPQRYSGEEADPRPHVRSGHIPSSQNLHYQRLLHNEYMQDPTDMAEVFGKQVPDPHAPVIFTCGSGITACILALGALESGYSDVRVYDGSWSEWGQRQDLPVETIKN